MRNRSPTRKQRFLAALALRGMTQADWAAEHGVTGGHLSLVLNDRRESIPLLEKIDATIEAAGLTADAGAAA